MKFVIWILRKKSLLTRLEFHWETNLARCQSWKAEDQALTEAHAKKLDKESKTRVKNAAQERMGIEQEQEEQAWAEKMASATDRGKRVSRVIPDRDVSTA